MVARCEVDAIKKGGENSDVENIQITVKALNEFDVRITEWRQKIDAQRGSVLATELKNNASKLAKWTAQSLLAGNHLLKIG